MRKIILLSLIFILTLSFTAFATEIISTDVADENVIYVENDTNEYEDIIVYKTGDGDDDNGSEYYDFYGYNAAVLASGDSAVITIESADISTDAAYATAVFAYGGSIAVTSASIRTLQKNSGGIMVTGGGTILAEDLNIVTMGNSSAAIRSDRGGGTINSTGGTYESNGQGSPAIYSTASISVSSADLLSTTAQGVVIEGGNSVTLTSIDMTANHDTLNGQDKTYQAVLIYQSGSGDASDGRAAFTMTDGSITNNKGDIFCVTNTACTINLTNVKIENGDSSGNFFRAEGQNWGKSGSNGGTATLTASKQTMKGNVLVSSDSSLTMTLKDNSAFTGAFNPDSASTSSTEEVNLAAAGGTINLNVGSGSKVTLTGNSYITSLTLVYSNDINYGNYSLTVANDGEVYTSSNPRAGTADTVDDSGDEDDDDDDSTIVIPVTSDDIKTVGPANVGCNLGCAGVILLACAALIMKKK